MQGTRPFFCQGNAKAARNAIGLARMTDLLAPISRGRTAPHFAEKKLGIKPVFLVASGHFKDASVDSLVQCCDNDSIIHLRPREKMAERLYQLLKMAT